jgi:hypothetical protein
VAEAAAQVMAEGVIRVEVEGLLQGGLGLVRPFEVIKELRLTAVNFRVGGILGKGLVQRREGGLVLAVGVLLEGAVDLLIDRLAAPFEFLAAAAGAGVVRFESHA